MMFSTPSRDNDVSDSNCSAKYNAPWWFSSCHSVFLTGELGATPSTEYAKGISWRDPWGLRTFAKFVRMMIRQFE